MIKNSPYFKQGEFRRY